MVGIISYEKFCTIFCALSYKCPATWAISAPAQAPAVQNLLWQQNYLVKFRIKIMVKIWMFILTHSSTRNSDYWILCIQHHLTSSLQAAQWMRTAWNKNFLYKSADFAPSWSPKTEFVIAIYNRWSSNLVFVHDRMIPMYCIVPHCGRIFDQWVKPFVQCHTCKVRSVSMVLNSWSGCLSRGVGPLVVIFSFKSDTHFLFFYFPKNVFIKEMHSSIYLNMTCHFL